MDKQDLYSRLSYNMAEMENSFASRMRQYEADLKKVEKSTTTPHKDLESLAREFTEFKSFTLKSLSLLKTQLDLLVLGLDRPETASRKKVLLLHGITDSSDDSLEQTVTHTLSDKLKLDISTKDICSLHRLGSNKSKPRPVLIRFTSHKQRSTVWNAKSGLKSTGITVSEFLTKPRHDAFMLGRKHFGIRNCWTSEGKIIVQTTDGKRHKCETMAELKLLVAEFPVSQPTTISPAAPSQAKAHPPLPKPSGRPQRSTQRSTPK